MQKNVPLDKVAALFSAVMFFVYLFTLSISLDDYDSVQFALGLREFDVVKHQPHPPGFPIYMALGTLLNAVLKNELLSLTSLGALFGALTLFAVYALAKEIFGEEAALQSEILTAITPLFWMNSVMAMSDMTALFFTVSTSYFLYKYIKNKKPNQFYAGALLAAFAVGTRVHTLFMLAPAILYSMHCNKKYKKANAFGFLIFLLAIAAWFLPLLLITGVSEYSLTAKGLFDWMARAPAESVLGSDLTPSYFADRATAFLHFFALGGYGVALLEPSVFNALLLLFITGISVLSLKKIDYKNKTIVFFSAPLALYSAVIFMLLPPYNPRYFLILIPLLSMVFANTIGGVKIKGLRNALFALLALLLLIHSLPLALEIHSVPAPPVQLINYLNENGEQEKFIFLTQDLERHFYYYPARISLLHAMDCVKIKQLISENKKVFSVTRTTSCADLRLEEVRVFKRSPAVHIKHNKVTLFEFIPSTKTEY